MVNINKIPKKPSGRNRSRFLWWRRYKSHGYLPVRKGLLARIQNGDFEYPDLFTHAEWELHWMKEDQKEFLEQYQGRDPLSDSLYHDIERKYIKRYNRCRTDAYEMEMRHLNTLVEDICKEFEVHKDYVMDIMETYNGTTEQLYYHIAKKKGYNIDTFMKLNTNKIN